MDSLFIEGSWHSLNIESLYLDYPGDGGWVRGGPNDLKLYGVLQPEGAAHGVEWKNAVRDATGRVRSER